MLDDYNRAFLGKSKSYIIQHCPHPITNIKHIGNHYEILISERYRNYYVGNGITYYHIQNDRCYRIQTNEYYVEKRIMKKSIF